MTKETIYRIHQKILNRLPKSYPKIPLKIYATTPGMLRAISRGCGISYKNFVDHWNQKLENPEYIKTKYRPINNKDKKLTAFSIVALALNPITLSLAKVQGYKVYEVGYILLHELGHHILDPFGKGVETEKQCDRFASRWIRKLREEGILKGELRKKGNSLPSNVRG